MESPTVKVTRCYVGDNAINLPERIIDPGNPSHTYHAIRGYGYVMAVRHEPTGFWVGHISAVALGYDAVSDYLQAKHSV